MASTTGIGVGVCALIIGLSAMNGFEYELNNRVLSLIPGAEVSSYDKTGFYNLEGEVKALEKAPNIKAVSPAVSLMVLLASVLTLLLPWLSVLIL